MKVLNDKFVKNDSSYQIFELLLDNKQHVNVKLYLSDCDVTDHLDIDTLKLDCLASLRFEHLMPGSFKPTASDGSWVSADLEPDNLERLAQRGIKAKQLNTKMGTVAYFGLLCNKYNNDQCKELFEDPKTEAELMESITEYVADI